LSWCTTDEQNNNSPQERSIAINTASPKQRRALEPDVRPLIFISCVQFCGLNVFCARLVTKGTEVAMKVRHVLKMWLGGDSSMEVSGFLSSWKSIQKNTVIQ